MLMTNRILWTWLYYLNQYTSKYTNILDQTRKAILKLIASGKMLHSQCNPVLDLKIYYRAIVTKPVWAHTYK